MARYPLLRRAGAAASTTSARWWVACARRTCSSSPGLDQQVDRELGDHLQQRDPRFAVRTLAHRHQARVGELRDLARAGRRVPVRAATVARSAGPASTPSRRKVARSGAGSRSWLHAIVARSVCWRTGRPVSRGGELQACCRAGPAGRVGRAACTARRRARSPAASRRGGGRSPPRPPSCSSSRAKPGRTSRARCTNSCTAPEPAAASSGSGGRVGQLQGRDGVLGLAHQVQRAARRREHGQPGRGGQHVLHHLAAPPAAAPGCRARAAPRATTGARASSAGSGPRSAARGRPRRSPTSRPRSPPTRAGRSRSRPRNGRPGAVATSTASRVLPLPPAPVRVSSRAPPSCSSAVSSATSPSRPTIWVGGTGRLLGVPRVRSGGNPDGRPSITSWCSRSGLRDVLEPVQAEPADRHAVRHPAGHPGRRVGQHDLTAVRAGGDPGRQVHVHADVAVLVPCGLTGVQAHPDPHAPAVRPGVGSQRALRPDGCVQRLDDALEHDEEAVALGPHLVATVACEGVPQDRALGSEHRRVPVAQPGEQPGGTLDVAEEQGQGALREVGLHARIITASEPSGPSAVRLPLIPAAPTASRARSGRPSASSPSAAARTAGATWRPAPGRAAGRSG